MTDTYGENWFWYVGGGGVVVELPAPCDLERLELLLLMLQHEVR